MIKHEFAYFARPLFVVGYRSYHLGNTSADCQQTDQIKPTVAPLNQLHIARTASTTVNLTLIFHLTRSTPRLCLALHDSFYRVLHWLAGEQLSSNWPLKPASPRQPLHRPPLPSTQCPCNITTCYAASGQLDHDKVAPPGEVAHQASSSYLPSDDARSPLALTFKLPPIRPTMIRPLIPASDDLTLHCPLFIRPPP